MSKETEPTSEIKSIEAQLKEARHRLAQRAGVSVSDEPLSLDEEDMRRIAEKDFGNPHEVGTASLTTLRSVHLSAGALKPRLDKKATVALAGHDVRTGETVELIQDFDPLDKRFLDSKRLTAAQATLDRTNAVIAAVNLLGGDGNRPSYLDSVLEDTKVEVYSSPHNGAPTLEIRTIELPTGIIYEMNAYAVGVPDQVLDTQVVVAPH